MSLLTGDPRSATVTAITDCELIEIGADAFRNLVLADSALVDHVTAAVTKRRQELEQHAEPQGHRPAGNGAAANARRPRPPVPEAVGKGPRALSIRR